MARGVVVVAVELHACRRARSRSKGRVATKHSNTRAVLRATKRNHVFANMHCNNFTMLRTAVSQDILNKVIAKLITGNVDEWHARTIRAAFADPFKVAVKELIAANLEAFLNDFGGVLIHTVFGSKAEDMANSTATISWSTMLADVLDTPVAKLTVRDDINASKNLVDAGTLVFFETVFEDVLDD